MPKRKPSFDKAHVRLIEARLIVMKRDFELADILCRYTFDEGLRVKTLARDRDKIVYDRGYVLGTDLDELADMLMGIARRVGVVGKK